MASISDVRIANMALSNLGAKSTIASLDENVPEAKAAKLWFDPARIETLEAFDWSFARKRKLLASSNDAVPEGWVYRYLMPADAVKARRLVNPLGRQAKPVPFIVEPSLAGTSKTILTDLEEATLVYTFDQQTTSMFSWHFVDCMAHRMAFHMAMTITGKLTIKQAMERAFRVLIRQAPADDANEGIEDEPKDADWIAGR